MEHPVQKFHLYCRSSSVHVSADLHCCCVGLMENPVHYNWFSSVNFKLVLNWQHKPDLGFYQNALNLMWHHSEAHCNVRVDKWSCFTAWKLLNYIRLQQKYSNYLRFCWVLHFQTLLSLVAPKWNFLAKTRNKMLAGYLVSEKNINKVEYSWQHTVSTYSSMANNSNIIFKTLISFIFVFSEYHVAYQTF